MSQTPPFDLELAHRWFSADCFNRVWGYLDHPDRTANDDETMLSLAHASIAHWRDRKDCTDQNLSIACRQLSRVHAVLKNPDPALHYGRLCHEVSTEEPPFYLGYAHEAIARPAKVSGDDDAFQAHLKQALKCAAQVESAEDRGALETDLLDLKPA